jgi:hypothetical protein
MIAVMTSRRPAGGRGPDHQPGEGLVGVAAGDLQQVLPELLFRIGLEQHVLRRVVHAAQVAGVLELPPRHSRGEASSSSTLAPASRAMSAAQRAALPPPMTRTSCIGGL